MGKKSNQKKNRSSRGNSAIVKSVNSVGSGKSGLNIPSLSGSPRPLAPFNAQQGLANSSSKPLNFGEQTEYIRTDITRILLLLVSVALVIIILVIVNQKSPILQNAGQKLSHFMQL
jgi:hypothetical protein